MKFGKVRSSLRATEFEIGFVIGWFQARESYYSGSPLIVDDMFDRVEVIFMFRIEIILTFVAWFLHLLTVTVEAPVVRFEIRCQVSSLQP